MLDQKLVDPFVHPKYADCVSAECDVTSRHDQWYAP
jgi:hypothetical protein